MPPLLAGRDAERARAVDLLIRTEHFASPGRSPLILTGVRGVGKTVTLRAIADDATRRGFVAAHITVDRRGPLAERIAAAVAEQVSQTDGIKSSGSQWRRWRELLGRLSVEVSVAGVVKIARPSPGTGTAVPQSDQDALIGVLANSSRLLREHQRPGLLLTLDELQEAPETDLAALAAAMQDLPDAPLVVICAGLPHTPDRLMAAGSFSERFQYQVLGPLDQVDANAALLVPATARGVGWDQDAADLILSNAAGAPYLIQLYGDAAWRHANPPPRGRVRLEHAKAGIRTATTELHSGLFRGRWNRASALEQQYLSAIAACLGPDGTAETHAVSARLSRTPAQLSYLRSRLLDKGLITAAGRGRVGFTLPGFDAFVAEQNR
jgi:hypothetical protein